MNEEHLQDLERDGYTIHRRFLSTEVVAVLRAIADRMPWDSGLNGSLPTVFAGIPELVDVVTGERTLELLRTIAGDGFTIFPNFAVRRNAAVPWHIDPAFRHQLGGEGRRPWFLQCAVYLQANESGSGGGLEVIPKSHERIKVDGRYFAPADALDVMKQRRLLDTHGGDLVIWDGRLLHASSPVMVASAISKYAIHWTVARQSADTNGYLRHLRLRSTPHSGAGSQARYQDMERITFPGSFSKSVSVRLERYRARLATMADLATA